MFFAVPCYIYTTKKKCGKTRAEPRSQALPSRGGKSLGTRLTRAVLLVEQKAEKLVPEIALGRGTGIRTARVALQKWSRPISKQKYQDLILI